MLACLNPCRRFLLQCRKPVALALLFAAGTLTALAQDEKVVLATLPQPAQTTLERLGSLSSLPVGTWKTHSGDLPHGEAVGIDESTWQPIAENGKAQQEAIWLRQTVEVPKTLKGYDLTGARIWFQLRMDGDGPMPQIVYFNGRRVAMGEDLEPLVLLDDIRPGDKTVVAVKILHTESAKVFVGATFHVEFAEKRPNPSDLRTEFISAAWLVPSLAPGDASKMTTLTEAIGAVDLKALDTGDSARFDASLLAAQHKLETLKPLLESATFHLTGNSHIDAAWLWPWTETVDVVRRTFGTALQLMHEYPAYTYTQSAAAYNEWMAQKYPDEAKQIAARIKEGRWEVVGGMWVEPDLNMPDGESLVRQLLVGKRWFKQAYGVDVRIGWNPDSFGYNWQLPQIYKKSGVDYFVTQKMDWNDTNQLPFKLFWWESPDGSKVLTYFPHGYGSNDLNPARLSGDLADARKKSPGLTEMMDLYGSGDHGGGATRFLLDEGVHWANATGPNSTATVHPKFDSGTALPFFQSVEKQIAPESQTWDYKSIAKGYTAPAAVPGKTSIPTWNSELYLEYHRGVQTTQANHKRNMREAEEQVLNAEKWASLAWLDGRQYPGAEITEDWKKVLFNQFHDLAAGSGIGIIYKDAQKDYDVVRWSTNEIKAHSLETVSSQIDTRSTNPGAIPVVVWNPLGWERHGDITVKVEGISDKVETYIWTYNEKASGLNIAHVVSKDAATGSFMVQVTGVSVPALGYRLIYLYPAKNAPEDALAPANHSAESNAYLLENAEVRVTIDKASGCITSLMNKTSNFELISHRDCGNQLQFFKDTPKDYDAWNIDPGALDQPPTLLNKADSVELVGSLEHPAVRVTYSWQKSKFVQIISLPKTSGQVDIENDIDWHEQHILLKAAFPLSVESDHATYEIPYGSIERTTKRTNTWEKAQFEVPALRWADLGDGKHGMSVINESKYGYDAVGNVLRLSLLRSPTSPDPEADQGHHHFHYALYPHAGTWQQAMTVRHAWEYNYPLTAVVTTAHPGELPASHSFISVTPDNVVLTAVKKAEDTDGLIFRVYEWAGKAATVEFHVPPGATAATVTNMQETPEGSALPLAADTVKAPIKPFEILTIRVDYPAKK